MPLPHRFLVVEGCNGVGKSTLVEYLCARFGASSFHYPPEFVTFRREARLDETVAPVPRLTYYLAGTLHLSDLVRDQLTKGPVICDRYLPSPLSLMVGQSAIQEAEALRLLEPFRAYLKKPDLILLLRADHSVVGARIQKRAVLSGNLTAVAQQMRESEEFYVKRENASRRFAEQLGPVAELDTTHLTIEEMCQAAWSLLSAEAS